MVYAEIQMTEPKEQNKGPQITEDPRLEEITTVIFQELALISPSLPIETTRILVGFAEKQARKIRAAEIRAEEAERKKTELEAKMERDPYNPEVYSAEGWYRTTRDWVRTLRRNGQSTVIMALDIDNFKEYNDSNKDHVKGDIALGLAGTLIKGAVRSSDLVARIHGDEYVVMISNADLKVGAIAAENIRQSVSGLSGLLDTTIPLSISIGIAILDEKFIKTEYDSDEEFVEALKQSYTLADKALYDGAKKPGKNGIGAILPTGEIQTATLTHTQDGNPNVIFQASVPI